MSEQELIRKIKDKDKAAIKELYLHYAPIMLGICTRYCSNKEDGKDVMHECFIKIITKIDTYSGKGNFEGWMKRIMVNGSLDHYKRTRKSVHVEIDNLSNIGESDKDGFQHDAIDKSDLSKNPDAEIVIQADFTKEEIIECVKSIPDGYRIIFNLFVLENYSHQQIAESLGVDEKVSRTRLFRAKEMIKKVLYQKSIERIAK